jgi:hypothetical protein
MNQHIEDLLSELLIEVVDNFQNNGQEGKQLWMEL